MKHKCPYKFPLRSRAAMINYLVDHESYGGWNHPYRRWSPLSWNVKIYGAKYDGKRGEYKTDDALDEAWDEYIKGDNREWEYVIEYMRRHYEEKEYTTYPGDDQGDWNFCFAGRSGGHMLLKNWEDLDFLRTFSGEDDWREWLDGIMFSTLRTLYKAVACMDQDFTSEKIERDFEYHLNWRRQQWEEEKHREQLNERAAAGLEPCPAI